MTKRDDAQPVRKEHDGPLHDSGPKWSDPRVTIGLVCLGCASVFSRLDRDPTITSWYMMILLASVGAGCLVTFISGELFLNKGWIKGSGALGVAAFVFWLGFQVRSKTDSEEMQSSLFFDKTIPAAAPDTSEIYIAIEQETFMVKAGELHPITARNAHRRDDDIKVTRGVGGLKVHFKTLRPGEVVCVGVFDKGIWWKSDDMTIPETQLTMTKSTAEVVKNRFKLP